MYVIPSQNISYNNNNSENNNNNNNKVNRTKDLQNESKTRVLTNGLQPIIQTEKRKQNEHTHKMKDTRRFARDAPA